MAMSNPNSLQIKYLVDQPLMSFGTYEGREDFEDPALNMTSIQKDFDQKLFKDLEDDIGHYYEECRKINSI